MAIQNKYHTIFCIFNFLPIFVQNYQYNMAEKKEALNRIREVLEEQGRTQTWLTKKLGLAFGTVNAWCNNRSQPYLTDLVRTAEVLRSCPCRPNRRRHKKRKRPD
jgi:putative transcriptional regulator